MKQHKNFITQLSTKFISPRLKKNQPSWNLTSWAIQPGWKYKNITYCKSVLCIVLIAPYGGRHWKGKQNWDFKKKMKVTAMVLNLFILFLEQKKHVVVAKNDKL
jgi:hypothetical protein